MTLRVGVVGAGTMGVDVAFDFASHGHSVVLKDIAPAAFERAKKRVDDLVKLVALTKKGKSTLKRDEILSRIRFTLDYSGFESAQFVVENVVENVAVKRAVYGELGPIVQPDAIIGVNTSCVSITKVGSWVPNPQRVIGTHFLNPVPVKALVEVIRGHHTSDATVQSLREILLGVEKECVVVKDYPGFVTNRVLMVTINEAAWVVQDGIADAASVDKVFTKGFSNKMGPLATGDLIGLDTILHSLEVLYESYKDSKYRPCPLLVKMVDAGLLGRKSGKGFFNYGSGE